MATAKDYLTLRSELKAGQLRRAYIFYGPEAYLRSSMLQQVCKTLIPAGFEEFNYHKVSGKGLSVNDLQEMVEAMPMMAQATLTVVEDLDIFRLDEAGRTQLIALLEDIPEYATVIFSYNTLEYKRDGKMKKALRRHRQPCAGGGICPAGQPGADKMGTEAFRRRRPYHRSCHGGASFVHLRQYDDQPRP